MQKSIKFMWVFALISAYPIQKSGNPSDRGDIALKSSNRTGIKTSNPGLSASPIGGREMRGGSFQIDTKSIEELLYFCELGPAGIGIVLSRRNGFHSDIRKTNNGRCIGFDEISDQDLYNWLHNELKKANDIEGLERIEKDKFPDMDLIWKYRGHHHIPIDFDSTTKSSPCFF
jgi:hypothetical protein